MWDQIYCGLAMMPACVGKRRMAFHNEKKEKYNVLVMKSRKLKPVHTVSLVQDWHNSFYQSSPCLQSKMYVVIFSLSIFFFWMIVFLFVVCGESVIQSLECEKQNKIWTKCVLQGKTKFNVIQWWCLHPMVKAKMTFYYARERRMREF